jgi:hypothetical protein
MRAIDKLFAGVQIPGHIETYRSLLWEVFMPLPTLVYQVLVATPSDCAEERKEILELISEWNSAHSREFGATLQPVLPETSQSYVSTYSTDLLIGTFWTRLETDSINALLGWETVEALRSSGKPVMLYFCDRPLLSSVNPDQYSKMRNLKAYLESQSLLDSYKTIEELGDKMRRGLATAMSRTRVDQDLLEAAKAICDYYERAKVDG